jgi:competence protein ComEA
MNEKERLASVILIITLAIGIVADVHRQKGTDDPVSEAGDVCSVDSCFDPVSQFRRLDINSAGREQLVILPGIGPKKADAIVAWRDVNGPFTEVDQLADVHGIGPKTIERLRAYVCIGR